MSYSVGVDIGGTKTVFGLLKNNKILKKIKIKTKKNKKEIINDLKRNIELILTGVNKSKVKGIGIGVPGIIDRDKGRVLYTPNTALSNVNLKEVIERRFNLEVKIENDTKCFTIAEKRYGIGSKFRNFIVLTLGTGIGGGIVINNKLYLGRGNAGEFGLIKIVINDGIKNLEELASGMSIIKRSKKVFGKDLLADNLEIKARKGDRRARKILEETGCYLGLGLSFIVNVFDPEIIIIAGGVRSNVMLRKAKYVLEKEVHNKRRVVFSELEDRGVLGAAFLVE